MGCHCSFFSWLAWCSFSISSGRIRSSSVAWAYSIAGYRPPRITGSITPRTTSTWTGTTLACSCSGIDLFGTYQEELAEQPCVYGIRGQLKSWNPVWANAHYYWAMAKDCWHARSWWDKMKVWFAPPGWRPADVASRFPKAEYVVDRDFVKFEPPLRLSVSLYVFVQFLALMAANSQFLALLPRQGTALNILYFVFIVVSVVAWAAYWRGGVHTSWRKQVGWC